ncbi:MAG: Gx transporter family protein [Clostridia bacterium]|nr:Gx transporter family protein [Clostridia bacterium]
MKSGKFTAKKIAVLAIFITLSLITFIIENQFPPLFVPGARMGLANIFSFTALIMFSPVEAFIVVAVRTGLGAIYAGNVSALLYSFTGGVVSMAISSVLMYTVYPRVSVMAVSVLGAVAHNVTQNIVFVLLTDTSTLTLIPYFILAGILSGAIVGAVTLLLFKKIPMSVFEKTIGQKKLQKLQPEQQQENLNEN